MLPNTVVHRIDNWSSLLPLEARHGARRQRYAIVMSITSVCTITCILRNAAVGDLGKFDGSAFYAFPDALQRSVDAEAGGTCMHACHVEGG